MQYRLKIILATLMTAFMAASAFGETPADSVKVLFRVGYSQYNPALGDNRAAMDGFIENVRKAREANEIDSIVVRAYASPDGNNKANIRLSGLRCTTVADLIEKRAGINPDIIHTIPEGVAWNELRRMVADNLEVPSREKILDILDNVPLWIYNAKGEIVDGRKKRLMELDRGNTYRWLLANIFPQLRNAVGIALYTKKEEPITAIEPEAEPDDHTDLSQQSEFIETDDKQDTTGLEETDGSAGGLHSESSLNLTKDPKPFYMAVKTNMLYDAALIPNIGAEFYIGKDFSVYGEWMYAWWDNDSRHRYWRAYGGDLGARWWFGRKAHAKPLSGHHVGIYCGLLTFDIEFGNHGYMGGKPGGTLWDRCLINSGIEYGYSLPVANRLNIDFSIGLGYLGGNYIKYFPFDNDYYREKEIKMRYFGPTKAEISLVWLLGRGNTNKRKGGSL